MMIWMAIIFVFLWAMPAHAVVFWDDEMENSSTRFNASGYLVGTLIPEGRMTFDTSVKFSGAGSLRLNYPANCDTLTTQNQCGGAASAPIPATEDLWQRVYFRMSGTGPNATGTGSFIQARTAYTKMMKNQNGSVFPRSWAVMGQNSSHFTLHFEGAPQNGGVQKVESSMNFANDRWYCIEWRIKMNTYSGGTFQANGIGALYVDNVLVGSRTDLLMRNTTVSPTAVMTEAGVFRQVGHGNIWYDRWAVGNTRIGCIGSGGGDSTPPATPSGWTIY